MKRELKDASLTYLLNLSESMNLMKRELKEAYKLYTLARLYSAESHEERIESRECGRAGRQRVGIS